MSDLDNVKRDLTSIKEHLQALNGSFAGIESHLIKLFEWKIQVDKRLDRLDGGQPPAA